MKKIIASLVCACLILLAGMQVQAKEVTTLEMSYESETIDVIQGVIEITEESSKAEDTAQTIEIEEPEAAEEIPEETTFAGNYGSTDEDEWINTDPEDCSEHIWEYSYDDDESSIGEDGEIIYFRFCLNCGYTEYLEDCPEELESTLPGYEENISEGTE